MRTVSFRLPEDIHNRLDAIAKRTGQSKNFYMKEAICEHIGELEKVYLIEKQLIKNDDN